MFKYEDHIFFPNVIFLGLCQSTFLPLMNGHARSSSRYFVIFNRFCCCIPAAVIVSTLNLLFVLTHKIEANLFAECDDGFYDDNCNSTCGHCLNGEICDKKTGHCVSTYNSLFYFF